MDSPTFPPLDGSQEPGNATGPLRKMSTQLDDINDILNKTFPLIGSTVLLVRMVASLIKSSGGDIGPFADEIARLEQSSAGLQADIDAFNAKYPKPVEPAPEPPTE